MAMNKILFEAKHAISFALASYVAVSVLSVFLPKQAYPQSSHEQTEIFANAATPSNSLPLGYEAYQKGNFEKAAEYLESARESELMISDYAAYYLGETYISLNRFDEALNAFDICANYHIKSPMAPLAIERMGDVYLAKGDIENAINAYKGFLSEYQDNAKTADVLYKIVSMLLSSGRRDEAASFMKKLLIEFPQVEYSDNSIIAESKVLMRGFASQVMSNEVGKLTADEFYIREKTLLKAKRYKKVISEIKMYLSRSQPWFPYEILPERSHKIHMLLAHAFYESKNYNKAILTFKDMLYGDNNAIKQESLIWLAKTYIKLKDFETAKDILKVFIAAYADKAPGPQAGDYKDGAFYRLAMIAKDEGDTGSYLSLLRQLLAENPSSPYKNDILWQISWTNYLQGNLEESLETLRHLEGSPLRMRAAYWQGRIHLMMGKKDSAATLFKNAAKSFPPNYYSSMSRRALEKISDFKSHPPHPPKAEDSDLRPKISQISSPPLQNLNLNVSTTLKRAHRLLELGLNNLASKELASADHRQNAMAVSLLYKEAGDFYHSYLLARNQSYASSAFDYYQLAFPEGYKELIEQAAGKLNLDPFLIYAVMMQESEFNEKAVSNAGAVGLLQIMPVTGEMIARKLSRLSFKEDDLFAPSVNISFGAWYLKTLITRFNGNLPLALAAYNAGPNAVDNWLKRWGGRPIDSAESRFDMMDEFVENIPYQETRNYVERVMGYYEAYKTIYKNSEQ